jgi:hypothetical protein
VRWISDGHAAYPKAIRRFYRDPPHTGRVGRPRLVSTPGGGLTQVVKERKGRRVVRVHVRHCFGPAPTCPYTVRLEQLNGVLRDASTASGPSNGHRPRECLDAVG